MKSIKEFLAHYTWDIAYGLYSDSILNDGLTGANYSIVKNPYKNKWFADPFILEEDSDYIQLLVEEYDLNVRRGRIARLKIGKENRRIKECSIILDLPSHLSFPVIYRFDGQVYVHPENSASGASYIYRYDRTLDKLVEPKLIVEEPIIDAIIRKEGEIYRMFATRTPEANGCMLHEYISDYFLGPYNHDKEEIFENNTARMAGMFLQLGPISVRPAQDCYGDYGKAVIMYNRHTQLCKIEPSCLKYAGIHTFNSYNGSFVLDLKKYDFPLLYKIIRLLKK